MSNTNQNRPFYDHPKGFIWIPTIGFTARTNLTLSSSLPDGFIFCQAFENYADRIIGHCTAQVGAVGAGGRVGVSIYNSVPEPGTNKYKRIINCGVFTTDTPGQQNLEISPRVELPAGVYIAAMASNGTAVAALTGNSANINGVYVGQDLGTFSVLTTAHEVLPDFLDMSNYGGGGGSIPTIRLER